MEAQALSPQDIQEFKAESFEILNQVEEVLNKEGKNLAGEWVDSLFRSFHNLKSMGGFLMLPDLVEVSHAAENILDFARKTKLAIDSEGSSYLYNATGLIKGLIEGDPDSKGDTAKFVRLSADYVDKHRNLKPTIEKTQEVAHELTPAQGIEYLLLLIKQAGEALKKPELHALDLEQTSDHLKKIEEQSRALGHTELAKVASTLKNALPALDEEQKKLLPHGTMLKAFQENTDYLYGLAFVRQQGLSNSLLNKEQLRYESFAKDFTEGIEKKQEEIYRRVQDTSSFSFRIEVEQMAKIMKIVEDMVARMRQLEPDQDSGQVNFSLELSEARSEMESLYELMLKATRVPLKHLFFRFIRVIKNAAELVDKKIEFEMIGEDLEIDRFLLEPLNIAIMHLLRNSCDHGIETQEERLALHKKPFGLIVLKVWIEDTTMKISIKDDGQGLNPVKIREKLKLLQWYSAEELSHMPEAELFQHIFKPGFSTNTQVSRLSGRGVGMDVVKREMAKIKGSVEISSSLGHGLETILNIPYTLV